MATKATSRKRKILNPILLNKDRQVLHFLWRHRVSTFRGIKTVFYPKQSNEQAYYHLRRLKLGQYAKVENIDGTKKKVWSLDKRGFRFLVSEILPELKTKTYKPQRAYHDLMVGAALLGHWATNIPSDVKILSEQEMVSFDPVDLPTELRRERKHQSDGVWIFENGKQSKGIALEVELSGKSSERYEQICSFYTSNLFFEYIVWIVESRSLAIKILECSRRFGIPREGIHLFVLQRDFETLGWDSCFLNESMKTQTLAMKLQEMAGRKFKEMNQLCVNVESASNPLVIPEDTKNPFLDFSFSLENLKALRKSRNSKVS